LRRQGLRPSRLRASFKRSPPRVSSGTRDDGRAIELQPAVNFRGDWLEIFRRRYGAVRSRYHPAIRHARRASEASTTLQKPVPSRRQVGPRLVRVRWSAGEKLRYEPLQGTARRISRRTSVAYGQHVQEKNITCSFRPCAHYLDPNNRRRRVLWLWGWLRWSRGATA